MAASPQITTATKDVFRYQVGHVPLNHSGGTNTPVMSVNLPAGDWVIDTKVDSVNFGGPDFIRCALFNGPTQILGGSTIWAGSGVDTVGELSNKAALNAPGAALTMTPAVLARLRQRRQYLHGKRRPVGTQVDRRHRHRVGVT